MGVMIRRLKDMKYKVNDKKLFTLEDLKPCVESSLCAVVYIHHRYIG